MIACSHVLAARRFRDQEDMESCGVQNPVTFSYFLASSHIKFVDADETVLVSYTRKQFD